MPQVEEGNSATKVVFDPSLSYKCLKGNACSPGDDNFYLDYLDCGLSRTPRTNAIIEMFPACPAIARLLRRNRVVAAALFYL